MVIIIINFVFEKRINKIKKKKVKYIIDLNYIDNNIKKKKKRNNTINNFWHKKQNKGNTK